MCCTAAEVLVSCGGTCSTGALTVAFRFSLLPLQCSIKYHVAIGASAGEGSPRGFDLLFGACREFGSVLCWENHVLRHAACRKRGT